ncbi:MAG: 7-carboxy-7-deazaguanine synthase [Candidatus Binatia bacterium]
MYSVKEIFYTLQGEGAQTGRPAVFCRFAGCNLWSGREEDRATALCTFCDTDFIGIDGQGGGKFKTALELATAIATAWPFPPSGCAAAFDRIREKPYVVCTGGEPLLQLNEPLVAELHDYGFEVAIETNGTQLPPPGIDWVCVSPKAGTDLVLTAGNELKLIFPQAGAEPQHFIDLDFQHFFLQPMDGPKREYHTQLAVRYCLTHPQWRLSLQTHKLLGIL